MATINPTRAQQQNRQTSERLRQLGTVQIQPGTLRQIEKIINTAVRGQFQSEGGRSGSRWVQLAPSTVRQRARQGFGPGPILFRTGRLARAMSSGVAALNSAGTQARMLYDSAQAQIAERHQRGGKRLPARPIVALTPADAKQIAEIMAAQIRKGFGGK